MKNNAPIEKDSEHENGNRDAVATTDNLALKDIIPPAACSNAIHTQYTKDYQVRPTNL